MRAIVSRPEGTDMTLIQAGPHVGRPAGPGRLPNAPIRIRVVGSARAIPARCDSRGTSRPPGAPLRYSGTGVGMSIAAHGRRPVTVATTVGLALIAAAITLWLGLVGQFGEMAGGSTDSAVRVPEKLAVVRVEAGESIQDVATRVAPGAPVRQVSDRIRELNALNSTTLAAGQTLIAPVG